MHETHPAPVGLAKIYTLSQAARLAGAPLAVARGWMASAPPASEPSVSFVELAELVVVARYRRGSGVRVPLARLRAAHDFARQALGTTTPFASARFAFEGGSVLHDCAEVTPGPGIAVEIGGRFVLPGEFAEALDEFEYQEDGLAARWFPSGRAVPVVVDPRLASGQPVVEGRNLRVDVLWRHWRGGSSIEALADDFALSPDVVERALQHIAA